jgi:hypothetical protein
MKSNINMTQKKILK